MEEIIPKKTGIILNSSGKEEDDLKTSLLPGPSTINVNNTVSTSRFQLETSSKQINNGSESLHQLEKTTKISPRSLATEERFPSASSSKITQDKVNSTKTDSSTQEVVKRSRCKKRIKQQREGELKKSAIRCKQLKRKVYKIQHLRKNSHHKQSRKHFSIRFGMRRNYKLLKQENNEKTTNVANNSILKPGDDCSPSCSKQCLDICEGSPCNTDYHFNDNSCCCPCSSGEMNSNYNESECEASSPCTAECCENLSSPCPPNCPGDSSPNSCTDSICDCCSPCTPDCHGNTSCPCSPDCSCYNESPSMEEEI